VRRTEAPLFAQRHLRAAITHPADPISSTESAPITSHVAARLRHERVENPRGGTWAGAGIVSILRRWECVSVEPVAA
jgi:hypothetical protein